VYLQASTKYQKSEVIAKIVTEVRKKSPAGGFVKKDFYSGRWFEIGDEKARDKVGACCYTCKNFEYQNSGRILLFCSFILLVSFPSSSLGHAIRKAAGELGKKHSGGAMSSKKASKLAMQKQKLSSEQLHLDASLGLLGQGGLMNTSFLNNASLIGLNPSAVATGDIRLGLGLGDNQSDRATASFLRPSRDNNLLSNASAFPASQVSSFPPSLLHQDIASSLDVFSVDNQRLFLQSLQRQHLLMNVTRQQQQNLNFLHQPFSLTTMGLPAGGNTLRNNLQSLPLDFASPSLNRQFLMSSQPQHLPSSNQPAADVGGKKMKRSDT
jgi:hypothetical protein